MPTTFNPDPVCPSCGVPAAGRYCPQCGEKFLQNRDFELRHFLLEHVAHEVLDVDGKLLRTMRLLLMRPGMLASEYVAGRRKPYVSPLRLYLITFLMHVFLLGILAPHELPLQERVQLFDHGGILERLIASRNDGSSPETHRDVLEKAHWIGEGATLVIFLWVAAVQALLLIRLHRRYLEHLSLALCVSAFYLLLLVAGDLVAAVFWRSRMQNVTYQIGSVVGTTALPLYWCLSVRRFYSLGWLASAVVAILLTASTALAGAVLNFGMIALIIVTS